jgi:ABC-type uncharacterized transport system involved in gliding motility auxiliary subunit
MTIVGSAVVVGIVGVLNVVVLQNDREFDVTREGLYTLSPQTTALLGRLSREVKIYAFYGTHESDYLDTQETLERYARASSKLSFQMVSPADQPDLVERYEITSRGPRLVVLSGDQDARAKDSSESELTNAIIRVAEQTTKKVYLLTGHGEGDSEEQTEEAGLGAMARTIRNEGFDVAPLSLLRTAQPAAEPGKTVVAVADLAQSGATLVVPDDAALVVLAGPTEKLLPTELQALTAYLERGGRVVVALESKADAALLEWLSRWKVAAQDDVVLDRGAPFGAAAPLVYAAEEHPITAGLEVVGLMLTARSLVIASGGEPAIEARPLMVSGEETWGETQPKEGLAERDAADHPGPVNLGVVAVKHVPSHVADRLSDEARLVVFGDADWLTNKALSLLGNADLLANTVDWLAAEEHKISIGRKTREASAVFFTVGQLGVLKVVTLDLLWLLYVAVGLGIVLVRRQR